MGPGPGRFGVLGMAHEIAGCVAAEGFLNGCVVAPFGSLYQSHPDQVASEARFDFTLGHDKFYPEVVSWSVPAIDFNGRVISIPPLQLVAHTQDKGWRRHETREQPFNC
jgi:hypothetical protein